MKRSSFGHSLKYSLLMQVGTFGDCMQSHKGAGNVYELMAPTGDFAVYPGNMRNFQVMPENVN